MKSTVFPVNKAQKTLPIPRPLNWCRIPSDRNNATARKAISYRVLVLVYEIEKMTAKSLGNKSVGKIGIRLLLHTTTPTDIRIKAIRK